MQTVIVTGAGRGLGRSEALELARHGFGVVVSDIDQAAAQGVADEICAEAGQALAVAADCSDVIAAERLVAEAEKAFGQLDAVVNNAGVVRDRTLLKMSEEEWDTVINVHLRGHFAMTQAACRYWRAAESRGRVVCTSSTSGLMGKFGQSNYGAAKAGIAAFANIVAWEMKRYGITCNAIVPAARTRMTEGALGSFDSPEAGDFDFWAPENVAPLVAFLCSDASGDISGKTFGIQGDIIELYESWSSVASVKNGGRRFSMEDLATGVPAMLNDAGFSPEAEDRMARVRVRPGQPESNS